MGFYFLNIFCFVHNNNKFSFVRGYNYNRFVLLKTFKSLFLLWSKIINFLSWIDSSDYLLSGYNFFFFSEFLKVLNSRFYLRKKSENIFFGVIGCEI